MDPVEQELREKIKPIMENMVFQLVMDKPENPVNLKFNRLGPLHDQLVTKSWRIYFKW
jgi:hypothetical protein